MSTIRDVVNDNVAAQYRSYAESAIQALEAREAEAVETLREAASSAGISSEAMNEVLVDAGLMEETPTATNPNQISLEGIARQLTQINQRLDRAAQQVQRHGIRF